MAYLLGVLLSVVSACADGSLVSFICKQADILGDQLAKAISKNSGIALPTTISPDGVVANYSPVLDETDYRLKTGDAVKIEVAIHVEGYIATVGHTLVIGGAVGRERIGDALVAAHYASTAVNRLIGRNASGAEIFRAANVVAKMFNCSLSRHYPIVTKLKRYILDTGSSLPSHLPHGCFLPDWSITSGDVLVVTIAVSTKCGRCVPSDYNRTTIYNFDVSAPPYQPRSPSARDLIFQVQESFGVFPFALSSLSDVLKGRAGLPECLSHGLLRANPVMVESNADVVLLKWTCLIDAGGRAELISAPPQLPAYHSCYEITDEWIRSLIAAN